MNKTNVNKFISGKLNKNICSIVNNYLNYSIDNLIKIATNNETTNLKFINPNIRLTDIMVLCCKTGYYGLYFSTRYPNFLNKIKSMMINEKLTNHLKLIKDSDFYYLEFKINFGFNNRYSCHIDSLNILEKY